MRFPKFKDEWEVKALKDVCSIIGDGLHGTPNYTENTGYYFINGNNLINGKIFISENTKEISYDEWAKNKKKFTDNTLLLSINGTIGNVAKYKNENVMLGKSVAYLDFKQNSNFYYQLLMSNKIQKHFYSELTGTTIKNLSLKTIRETEITFPSISEQIRIAKFLSLIDEKIQTQSKIIEQLETLMQGLRRRIFTQKLRFKDSNGNIFPDCEVKQLGDIAIITTGSSNREDSILDGEFPFYDRSQDIRTSNRYLLDKEAIIVPGEGQAFLPKYYIGKFDLHQRTYAIFDFVEVTGRYLYFHILNDDKHLQSQAVGSTVKSLRLPMFQSMPIKVPDIKEQTKIANFLSTIDKKIEAEKKILEQYENQKKYLMRNIFI